MSRNSRLPDHWTDEQLIASIYGVGPEDAHADSCHKCQSRLSEMRTSRLSNETATLYELMPGEGFLHEQRRNIYRSLSAPRRWWDVVPLGRWAPGAAAFVVLLSGGVALYEHQQGAAVSHQQVALSDAQLAQDVSQMADSDEPVPAAPLRGLFE